MDLNINDMETDIIKQKILNSNYEFKKKILSDERTKNIQKSLENVPQDKLDEMINAKIAEIKNRKLEGKELERAECELAIMLSSRKINVQKSFGYWKVVEENARKKSKGSN